VENGEMHLHDGCAADDEGGNKFSCIQKILPHDLFAKPRKEKALLHLCEEEIYPIFSSLI